MSKLFYLIIIIILVFPSCVNRQELETGMPLDTSMFVSNDLSNQKVSSFAEDEFGHIWIGTQRGLNKHNVYEYRQYFCTGDTLSLPDNMIQTVFRDSQNRLWVGTANGICYYSDRDNFINCPIESLSRNIAQIIEDKSGRIFINTVNTLCEYDSESGVFEAVIPALETTKTKIVRCYISPDNLLWVVCPNSIRSFEISGMVQKDSISLSNHHTVSYMSEDGLIWLNSIGGIQIFDTTTKDFISIADELTTNPVLSSSYITGFYPYNDNFLLINTENHGLFVYNKKTGSVRHQNDIDFPFAVPDSRINTIYQDSQNNLWIGSVDQGYTVVYSYKDHFNNNNFLHTSTKGMSVISLDCDTKGNLWISTLKDGLYLWTSGDNNQFKEIDTESLFGNNVDIKCVFCDKDDRIWLISSFGEVVVCRFDGRNLLQEQSYQIFLPIDISQDDYGTIWISTASGYMCYLRSDEDDFKYLDVVDLEFTFITSILPYDRDRLIVGAFMSNLKEINTKTFVSKDVSITEEEWKKSIKHSAFIPTDMYVDSAGNIWIGTFANGLLCYYKESGRLTQVQGAPCADISAIEEDLYGNLWVSTQFGLGKYDRSVGKFINWYKADGIGGNQFYERSSCRLPNGVLAFGGTHGLTIFDPLDVTVSKSIQICFEDLKVHNESIQPGEGECIEKSLTYRPDIFLEHSQNCFSISFAAIDYSEYERVRYFYTLEGFDHHWIDAHNNREAFYSNVPPGKYNFKVRIISNSDEKILSEDFLSIKIDYPIWQTWYAYILYVLLIASVISFIVWLIKRMAMEKMEKLKAQQEKEQEKKVNEMNMNFFANISHEFRTPLTMISGPITQLQESPDMKDNNKRLLNIVQRNIRRMLRLVNQLLDFNKLENDTLKLQVKPIDLITQLRNLTDIFYVTATEKGIVFRTYGLEESLTIWADEDKLDKICFNLLSNAMKFTQVGGKVEFSLDVISREDASHFFTLEDKDTDTRYMKVVVKDSGPGIPENQLEKIFDRYYQLENQMRGLYNWGTGIGLYFAKTLAHMHHGYLKAGNRGDGVGAEFTLLLPVSEASYSDQEKCTIQDTGCNSPFNVTSIKYSELNIPSGNIDKKKVLIVDDDVDVMHYLTEILLPNYDVLKRYNADSAFTLLKEESVDIVISDVVMPDKDGYELCRQIKENIQTSHIPVILLTAKATVEDQVMGLNYGADAYVTKPFDPQYLTALVGSQIKNREKLRIVLQQSTDMDNVDVEELTPQDTAFMSNLYLLMENELSNSELDVAKMTEFLHISRTKFYYKVKGLTGQSPSTFFKKYKLNRAAQLLLEHKYNISEIADMTGFSTLSHFSTSFKKNFGVSPSEYVQSHR